MSTCAKCGGSLSNPFDFSNISGDTCQCNTGGLVLEGETLPNQTCCVVSVNGKTGVVVLNIDDIDLLGNQFFTNALVWASLSASTPIVFDNLSGLIYHADSGVVAGTYGSSSEIPIITVNSTGHVTNMQTTPIKVNYAYGDNLEALGELIGEGFAARTGVDTWALRTLTGTGGRITITNGDGIAGDPIFDLIATAVTPGTYGGVLSWPEIAIDAYGRITSATTRALPAPTIPAHTHALGDLSNVDPTANAPTTGDALVWDGSEWVPSSSAINFSTSAIVCEAALLVATSSNDIDAVELGQPINKIYRLADTNDRYKVSISAIFYILESDLTGFPGSNVVDLFIGTVPAGYEPMHPIYFDGPTYFTPTKAGLENFDGTVAFAGTQSMYTITYLIDTDGKVYLTIRGNSDYSCPTLTAVNNVILPLNCEYLTKLIVP